MAAMHNIAGQGKPVIPAEAVEAAAKYLHDMDCRSALHSGFPADIECYDWLEEAKELLEAAAPHMQAGAWDEGYGGAIDAFDGRNVSNPYRTTNAR